VKNRALTSDPRIGQWYLEEYGRFHINLHRSSYYNSSLGCTIITKEDEKEFKALLKKIKKYQKTHIPVMVVNFLTLCQEYSISIDELKKFIQETTI
jgi:hypothetical protein